MGKYFGPNFIAKLGPSPSPNLAGLTEPYSQSNFSKLCSSWLFQSSQTDLALNLVIASPTPIHTAGKAELENKIMVNIQIMDGLADIFG